MLFIVYLLKTQLFHIVSRLLMFFFSNIISEMFEAFSSNALNRVYNHIFMAEWEQWKLKCFTSIVKNTCHRWIVFKFGKEAFLPDTVKRSTGSFQEHFKEGKTSENIFSPGKNLVAWKLPKKCLKYTYFYFKWIKHIFSLSKAFIGPFPEKSAKSGENYLKPI